MGISLRQHLKYCIPVSEVCITKTSGIFRNILKHFRNIIKEQDIVIYG